MTSRRTMIAAAALVLGTLAVFWPVHEFGFIEYDDPDYLTANPHVLGGVTPDAVWWAFTKSHAANWHPLTWMSHMLDVQVFGVRAAPMLMLNVAVHAASACVLFLLLSWTTGRFWAALVTAAVFALHPLRAESVAWVSERKDVLGAFFYLVTLLAYARYARRPSAITYACVLVAFALGLLSKPMVVSAPCLMLLLDYWPLGRFRFDDPDRWRTLRKLGLEKAPMIVMIIGASLATYAAQSGAGAVKENVKFSLRNRLENVPVAYVRYVGKIAWPSRLAIYYPHPGRWPAAKVVGTAALVIAASVVATLLARRAPYAFVGWFWFLGTLVPAIGIVQVGTQSIADRYTYVPSIGLTIAVVFTVAAWANGSRHRRVAAACIATAAIVAFAVVTRVQLTKYWAGGTLALFQRAAEVTSDNWLAYSYIGSELARRNQPEPAAAYFAQALELNPNFAEARYNLGNLLARQQKWDDAIAQYARAAELRRPFPQAWNNRGVAEVSRGDFAAAERSFRTALEQQPDYADAQKNLAKIRSLQERK